MSQPITPPWLDQALKLLSGQLELDEKKFKEAAETLYSYVREKGGNRCLSEKLANEEARNTMIRELFENYKRGASANVLCSSRFLRKIVKHDKTNEKFLEFISNQIVPTQIKQVPGCEELLKNPAVVNWMANLHATIMDPDTLASQNTEINPPKA